MSGTCGDDCLWSVDETNTMLTVTGSNMADFAEKKSPFYTLKTTVTSVVVSGTFPKIGTYAFFDFKLVANVTLPETLIAIGDSAFEKCVALAEIRLPETLQVIGEYAFSQTTLSSVTLPVGLTELGSHAFGATRIEVFRIPPNVKTIGFGTITGMSSLRLLVFDGDVDVIRGNAISFNDGLQRVIFYGSVKEIYPLAMQRNPSLTDIVYCSNTVPSLHPADPKEEQSPIVDSPIVIVAVEVDFPEDELFEYEVSKIFVDQCELPTSGSTPECQWTIEDDSILRVSGNYVPDLDEWYFWRPFITQVFVEEGITAIVGSFYRFTELVNVSLPSTLKSIHGGSFGRCYSLESIVIPEGVGNIGNAAFYRCISLTHISLPSTLTHMGDVRWNPLPGVGRTYGVFENCVSLKKVVLPNSLKTISAYLFLNSGLAEVNIPPFAEITFCAFCNTSLTSLIIPNGVEWIYPRAFSNNTQLARVVMAGTVQHVGEAAFAECRGLKEFSYCGTKSPRVWYPQPIFESYDVFYNSFLRWINTTDEYESTYFCDAGFSDGVRPIRHPSLPECDALNKASVVWVLVGLLALALL